jgi:hypothetical protein
MTDFAGCLWIAGWLAFEVSMVVLTAKYLGWFWAVVLGVAGIVAPYALTRARAADPKGHDS